MAYVASWIAPQGAMSGGKNVQQPPRNADNINQTFVKNETEGYYKPPFCQWPFGGASKKEAKSRLKTGEPVCKAGSYEYEANDFYYGRGSFERPKDADECSIRTESTTLYLQSNLCTRTYGPNRKPRKLPGKVNRAKYFTKPLEKICELPESMKVDDYVNVFDTVKYDGRSPISAREKGKDGTQFVDTRVERHLGGKPQREIHPTEPKPVEALERKPSFPRLRNPKSYKTGYVPRGDDRLEHSPPPSWRKDALSKDSKSILVSPRTYLSAKTKVGAKKREDIDKIYEPNDQFIYFD